MKTFETTFITLAIIFFSLSETLGQTTFTPELVSSIKEVSSASISPDGSKIAYTLSVPRDPSVEDGFPYTELHMVNVSDGSSTPYITGKVNVGRVSWSPDGANVLFTSRRSDDANTTLYSISTKGGEAAPLLVFPQGSIGSYTVSGDGQKILFLSSDKAKKRDPLDAIIYEEELRHTRAWIADLSSGTFSKIDIEGHVIASTLSSDGKSAALSITPTPLVDDRYLNQRINIVDLATNNVRLTVDTKGKLGPFEFSPTGTHLAMLAAIDLHDPSALNLATVSIDNGTIDFLHAGEKHVSSFTWLNSNEIVFTADHGLDSALESINLETGKTRSLTEPGDALVQSVNSNARGNVFALLADAPTHPREVFVFTMNGSKAQLKRLTTSNPWLADMQFAKQEAVTYKAKDGLEIQGTLIRPLKEIEGTRYPLTLVVHGGPEAHYKNGWHTRYSTQGQTLAAKNVAVFFPNYRGSTGRGLKFSKMSQGDPAGLEFDDLIDAIDHFIDDGLVDGDKVAVTGGSYGGYATAWLSTKYSDRIAAGVMFVGISNKISKVGTTDIANEEFAVHALERVWDNWDKYLERSPIYHAENGKTPLLILHGQDDPRVDPGQSHELYRHLKLHGKAPVRLVLYPKEGHGNRRAKSRLDYNRRSMRWLDHYLNGAGGDPPPISLDKAKEVKTES